MCSSTTEQKSLLPNHFLKNTDSKEQHIIFGFPVDCGNADEQLYDTGFAFNEYEYMKKIETEFDMNIWINDKEIKHGIMKSIKEDKFYKYFFERDLTLQPNEELKIRTRHKQEFSTGRISYKNYTTDYKSLRYFLTTGSSWAESIDELNIEFLMPENFVKQGKSSISKLEKLYITPKISNMTNVNDSTVALSWNFKNI
jgi:hypothetical protein